MALVSVTIFKKNRVKLTREQKVSTKSRSWYGFQFNTIGNLVVNSTSIIKGVESYDVKGTIYYELLLSDNSDIIVNAEGLKLLSI